MCVPPHLLDPGYSFFPVAIDRFTMFRICLPIFAPSRKEKPATQSVTQRINEFAKCRAGEFGLITSSRDSVEVEGKVCLGVGTR
jgi:hypothetical protein